MSTEPEVRALNTPGITPKQTNKNTGGDWHRDGEFPIKEIGLLSVAF